MSTYRRYDCYKTVDVDWIKNIPSHWNIKKINDLFSERSEKCSDKEYMPLSVTKFGITKQLDTAVKSKDSDNRKKVLTGDFVINSRSDRRGSSGFSMYDGSVSLINIVLCPRESTSLYYHYLLRSHKFVEEFYHHGRGIVADLWTTRYSEMKNIYVPVPPLEEQNHIYDFLRWKTSVFNGLIPEKAITKGNVIASSKSLLARQMMLLDEYRTSLFSSTVMGEIDVRAIEIPEYEFVEDELADEFYAKSEDDDFIFQED
jgi:hypothetical protein